MKQDLILCRVLHRRFSYLVENYYFCIVKTLNIYFFMNIYRPISLWLNALVLVAFVFVTASCRSERDEPTLPKGEASRTVLVYMLASNNGLGAIAPRDYDIQDIDEMVAAARHGDLGEGRLLVYHSASNGNNVLKEITPEGVDTLKIYSSENLSQSSARLNEVLDDMADIAPAHDYGLILWGHGSGWLQDGIAEEESLIETYSYGSEQNGKWKMNITTLAKAIEGRGFSFLYMDCCYMASVEVIYQLRNAVPRIVAYPTEVLAYGMPYDENVKHFFTPTPGLVEAAQNTFDFYDAMPDYRYRMCTVSVINTSGLERLAAATRAIYQRNRTGIPAGYTPQPYMTSSTCYYHDFGSYVAALDSDSQLLDEYKAALSEVVEFELATGQIWGRLDINEHSGLSTFIMKSDADADRLNYMQLDWFGDVASALIK